MAPILKFKKIFAGARPTFQCYKQKNFLNTMAGEKLAEILIFLEGDQAASLLPEMNGKRVLFFDDQRHAYLLKKVMAREPGFFTRLVYRGEPVLTQRSQTFTVMGDLTHLCFSTNQFDVVVCPFELGDDYIGASLVQKLAGLIKNGGRLILSLRHPQLEHILFNQNPAENRMLDNSVANYFDLLKKNFLYTEELVEARVDHTVKPFFTMDGVFDCYHEFKGTPLTLLVRAVKFVRGD